MPDMRFSLFSLTVCRPVAVSMFFLAFALLGAFSWSNIAVELVPASNGDKLFVQYHRPASEPSVIEREILIPLESRIKELPGIKNTFGKIVGNSGDLNVEFEAGSNFRVRELELRELAASIERAQPEGSRIRVSAQNTQVLSRYVMSVQILSDVNSDAIRGIAEQLLRPAITAISGVSQVVIFGGKQREVTVSLDPQRCAALGISTTEVIDALRAGVGEVSYLGRLKHNSENLLVSVDSHPESIADLGNIQILTNSPVTLNQVADIALTTAPQLTVSRVNGQQAVSMVIFQNQNTNLVALGTALRDRLQNLQQDLAQYKLDLIISFDASEKVETQLSQLKLLALSGFLLALLVLFVFLRRFSAVAVVAISIPTSLLVAGALLYLSGYSLNVFTLFGLVIGAGMLIDNSIVVYEAVQRNIERGFQPEAAALEGIKRTIRAILTASATNAIVFMPLTYIADIPFTVQLVLDNVVPAILFPLFASLIVAVGLVPMLTLRFCALSHGADTSVKNTSTGLLELFSAVVKVALRDPVRWLAVVAGTILITLIVALPWVLVQSISQLPADAEQVRMEVEFDGGGSLAGAQEIFKRLELSVLDSTGVNRVESRYDETQGVLSVILEAESERPDHVNAASIRRAIYASVNDMGNVRLQPIAPQGSAADTQSGPDEPSNDVARVAISGPDMGQLYRLAEQIKQRLDALPYISNSSVMSKKSQQEIYALADDGSLAARGLFPEQVLNSLVSVGREGIQMPGGFNLDDGSEVPILVRTVGGKDGNAAELVRKLPVVSNESVFKMEEFVSVERRPAPIAIFHNNGKRELSVSYTLLESAPQSGPKRIALEEQIAQHLRKIYVPEGYNIETADATGANGWLKLVFIPVVLLLFALLAASFESLLLPTLILMSVPLTMLGSIWALVLVGEGIDAMAGVGVLVLMGLTVNPAILLIDRMQQKYRAGSYSSGAAAILAVRERVRPILMTSSTTFVGLWPMALTQGPDLALWSPFATVLMGGLVTSTLLTLVIIPIGFVQLANLEKVTTIMGLWPKIIWVLIVTGITALIIGSELVDSELWQAVTVLTIGGISFALLQRFFYRPEPLQYMASPMVLETRYLSKSYNQLNPVRKAWQKLKTQAPIYQLNNANRIKERLFVFVPLILGLGYLMFASEAILWQILFAYATLFLIKKAIIESCWLFKATHLDNVVFANITDLDRITSWLIPWFTLTLIGCRYWAIPLWKDEAVIVSGALLLALGGTTLLVQLAFYCAILVNRGEVPEELPDTRIAKLGFWIFSFSYSVFQFALRKPEYSALRCLNFKAETGLIGILGPNGAGKTTLLRILASVLEHSTGTVYYAGVNKRRFNKQLAKLIGYLPQDFGLPRHLTGNEYLNYYALLYKVGDRAERLERVNRLIVEVGLEDKQQQLISTYSGGMCQRLAVARTLLADPTLIIVDEPTVGLDPRERIRFRNLLSKLAKDRVVLFSTHVIEDVAVSCDRVIVLKKGRLLFDGKPSELSELANNKIWEVVLPQGQVAKIEKQFKVINQVLTDSEQVNLRVLSEEIPHQFADSVEANLEDGYFQLLNTGS